MSHHANAHSHVLAIVGARQVIDNRQEIMWRDGSCVGLYRVFAQHEDTTFLRATRGADTLWRVFDLRRAVDGIAVEFSRLAHADWPGLVFYSLRTRYASAAAFAAWVTATTPLKPGAAADLGRALDARSSAAAVAAATGDRHQPDARAAA